MKVLLATDGQRSSEHTIREAIRLLALDRAAVFVVSVLDPEERIGGNDDADQDIAAALAILASAGIAAQSEKRRGHFAEQITAYANEIGADIIVVGSAGQRPFMQWLSGSVSHEVIHQFRGCVFVVTHHE